MGLALGLVTALEMVMDMALGKVHVLDMLDHVLGEVHVHVVDTDDGHHVLDMVDGLHVDVLCPSKRCSYGAVCSRARFLQTVQRLQNRLHNLHPLNCLLKCHLKCHLWCRLKC